MARETIRLQIQDRANKTTLTFYSWEAAHNHIRQVILGGIIDELLEAAQWPPSKDKDEALEELGDVAKEINYPRDKEALQTAVERWKAYVGPTSQNTTIEIL